MAQALAAAVPAAIGAVGSAAGSVGSAAAGLGKAALSVPGALGKEALSIGDTFGKALAQAPPTAPMATNPLTASSPMAGNVFGGGAPLSSTGAGSSYRPAYQPDPSTGAPTPTGAPMQMPQASAPIAGPAPASGGPQQPSFGDMMKTMAMTRLASGAGTGGQDASAAMQAGMLGKPYAPSLQGGQGLTPDQIKQLLQRFGGKF